MHGIRYLLGLESEKAIHLEIPPMEEEYLSHYRPSLSDLKEVRGRLVEQSFLGEDGLKHPLSFMGGDFSRGEKVFKYPNGVLSDTLIHPMNAICFALGIEGLTLANIAHHTLCDRNGSRIQSGDLQNGEARAEIKGTFQLNSNEVTFELTADKLAERDNKGITMLFDDGTEIVFSRVKGKDTTELIKNGEVKTSITSSKEPYELLIQWFLSGKVFTNDLAASLNQIQFANLKALFQLQQAVRSELMNSPCRD